MIVTTATIESLVVGLFEHFRVRAGGRLALEDLREQWSSTRLRRTDLDVGIRELVFTGSLRWIDTEDGPFIELTSAGYLAMLQRALIDESTVRKHWGRMREKWGWARRSAAPEPHTRRYTDALNTTP